MHRYYRENFLIAIVILGYYCAPLAFAEPVRDQIDAFLNSHCYECHDDSVSKGDLNLLDLPMDLSKSNNLKQWVEVFHRVETGEMPPKKKPRPEAKPLKKFIEQLEPALVEADRKTLQNMGRTQVRRLTRTEYEHTMHDLLGIDIPLKQYLPEDDSSHLFETLANSQQLSQHLLAKYLEATEAALEEAFKRITKGDHKYSKNISANKAGRGSWKSGNYRGPEDKGGRAIAWPLRLQFYGRMPATAVPEAGWYRIKFKNVQSVNKDIVWGTLKSGVCSSNAPILHHIGNVEATKQKRDLVYEAWIEKRQMLEMKPADATIPRANISTNGGTVKFKGTNLEKKGTPGIAFTGIEMTRFYPNAPRYIIRKRLIGDITKEQFDNLPRTKLEGMFADQIKKFAAAAFRRPVTDAQMKPYLELSKRSLWKEGGRRVDALIDPYRAILCSPRFLTFYEKPGKLDQHALANRVSYMLWNSLPDQKLRTLANRGELEGQTLHDEVSRMIDDEKFDRFVNSYTDQWLKLKEINFTQPDARRYRTFDAVVQNSILAETRAFFKLLIKNNLSVRNLIHSDFAMVDERLSRFYRMNDAKIKKGGGIQKVELDDYMRGGLVTQASVLKVTADGTSTSPIVRGVYLGERILGLHIPPPPPGIPAVEPDIRGAVSIRDQLEKHRSSESCAGCHQKIDPAGFAFENFDPVGLWRTRYGSSSKSAKVDPKGTTPEGQTFTNIRGWKQAYLERPDQLTEAFARNLLTYSTGAEPLFSDREQIEKIVHATREKKYGMRSLFHRVIGSQIFQTK